MAQGRGRHNSYQRTSCVSPMWKHSTANNVVTLKMRPTQTTFTSLDTFMAAHSPRRFCQGRQKYILKPLTLDKRISESGFAPVQKDTRSNSGAGPRLYHGHGHIRRHVSTNSTCTATDSSSEGEHSSQRVLALGKCRLNNGELVQEGLSDPYRSAYFRPGPKVPMIFNRTSSIPTTSHDTSDLIAIGTIPITSQRQTPVKPMSRSSSEEDIELTSNKLKSGTLWKTKATLNLKGCKYLDPMVGASPSFQARITEMAQLELETIRFEKTKKSKKKASSS